MHFKASELFLEINPRSKQRSLLDYDALKGKENLTIGT